MNTYQITFKIGPDTGEVRELNVVASSMVAAYIHADKHLSLRYPHYKLIDVELIHQVLLPQDPITEEILERLRAER